MEKLIIPAVIAKTQEELDDIFRKIGGHVFLVQLDIMDGRFVPNHSLDFDFKLAQRKYQYEAHLMIENPEEWVEKNWKKVDTIIAHFEAVKNPPGFIKAVKSREKKIAFALNPETAVSRVRDYLFDIDQVLVMTVHPGFYGSQFLPQTLEKIRELRNLKPDLDIEVDGGINPQTIAQVDRAGANLFVSGSYLIGSPDIRERIDILKNNLRREEDQSVELGRYQNKLEKRLNSWKRKNFMRRLWARDHTLWFSEPKPEIKDRLGWLVLPEMMQEKLDDFLFFARKVKDEGISQVVLLGMGGSSLAPEVFQKTFGRAPDYPGLKVLDSTHPQAVAAVKDNFDLSRTLFVVSSKSGTTLETLSLFRYFWNQMNQVTDAPGRHFVAVTDPHTPLVEMAQKRGFREVFLAPSDVGGRYSAFTDFGLVPASLLGMDIHRLLDRVGMAAENNAFCVPEDQASGLILGAALGELAGDRDKLTIITSPSLADFPDWIEQLVAESTGKNGQGILPVVKEPLLSPEYYGKDRFFIFLSLEGDPTRELEEKMSALVKAGHPGVRINLRDKMDLGQEMFRWEIAVASAGSVLGVHPFNQPDVQLAKDFTQRAVEKKETYEQEDAPEPMVFTEETERLTQALANWLEKAGPDHYLAVHAYLAPRPEVTTALQDLRLALLKKNRLATTAAYGPRFLHSTGQLHKGGPNTGLFLQLVDQPGDDIAVPETDYTFARLIKAQAFGDFQALTQRKREVLRINLGRDILGGLERIKEGIDRRRFL
ncbi:MAG: ribulose-phosphate 3-epimerase [Candidatus Aminicenantes bacterium]